MLATGMPTIAAIGSSLVAVGVFGMTTAVNYAASGLVEWTIALQFIAGGIVGGWLGARPTAGNDCRRSRQTLTRVLGCMLVVVAAYMLYRSLHVVGRTVTSWAAASAARTRIRFAFVLTLSTQPEEIIMTPEKPNK